MTGYQQPYWNLLQVLAWVYLGDRKPVGAVADDVNDYGSYWSEEGLPGAEEVELLEVPANRPHMNTMANTAAWNGGPAFENLNHAKAAILNELQLGNLKAIGLEDSEGNPSEVPQESWAYLNFADHPPRAVPSGRGWSAATWYDLKFKSADVLALWPPGSDSPTGDWHETAYGVARVVRRENPGWGQRLIAKEVHLRLEIQMVTWEAWLTDVLGRIAEHKITKFGELMPWCYAEVAA